MLALAQPITLVLRVQNWSDARGIFESLTLIALYAPFSTASFWLFTSQGRGRDLFLSHVVLSSLTFAAILGGLPWGAIGVALAISATGLVIRLPVLWQMAGRRGPVATKDLFAGFFRHL